MPAEQLFVTWPFLATGGTTARTQQDREADIVNVREYGAVGDGSTNDAPALQAAFDAAFGSSGSPHGTNSTLNRAVWIPNGSYIANSKLTLTNIVNGCIFGDAPGSTKIVGTHGGTVLEIHGATGLTMETLTISGNSTSSGIGIDLDDPSNVGLSNNIFYHVGVSSADTLVRIAHAGNGGDTNAFYMFVGGSFGTVAIDAQSATAVNNMVFGGTTTDYQSGAVGFKSSKGSIHVYGFTPESIRTDTFDFQIDSGLAVDIIGGRSESANVFKVTDGLVNVSGFSHAVGGNNFATLSGGKFSINGCNNSQDGVATSAVVGSVATATGCSISGTTTLNVGTVTAGTIAVGQYFVLGSDPTLYPKILSGSGLTWNVGPPQTNGAIGGTVTFGSMLYLRLADLITHSGWSGATGSTPSENI